MGPCMESQPGDTFTHPHPAQSLISPLWRTEPRASHLPAGPGDRSQASCMLGQCSAGFATSPEPVVLEAGKVAQWMKVLAAKSDHLSLIPGT